MNEDSVNLGEEANLKESLISSEIILNQDQENVSDLNY